MSWFRFPEGTDVVSIERQNFITEARDINGRGYFRAPDHFAGIIKSLPGFSITDPPEGTDLPDLPKSDPLRDSTISEQARKIEALELSVQNLQTDNSAMSANLASTLAERDDLKLKLHEMTMERDELQEKIEEIEENQPVGGKKR